MIPIHTTVANESVNYYCDICKKTGHTAAQHKMLPDVYDEDYMTIEKRKALLDDNLFKHNNEVQFVTKDNTMNESTKEIIRQHAQTILDTTSNIKGNIVAHECVMQTAREIIRILED